MVRGTPACLEVRRVEEDLVAALADPQRYASPARECDIVMKGGITSGVIYPLAVLLVLLAFLMVELEQACLHAPLDTGAGG